MQNQEQILTEHTISVIKELYNGDVNPKQIQFQKTRKEFDGDITLVVFPFLRISKKAPEQTGAEIGEALKNKLNMVSGYNTVKGFLNIEIHNSFYIGLLNSESGNKTYGFAAPESSGKTVMVEYSSPNTNKPLHLGHIRNNLLGHSVCALLAANGHKVVKTNIVNDRGIHICKSMLAWEKWGNGETPESTSMKGDHLVGKYYVIFDQEYKKEIAALIEKGSDPEEAKKTAPLLLEAQEMLRKWEAKDPETIILWETMNQWVYNGFDVTYNRLGITFDKIYYESDTYISGKDTVLEGLEKGVVYRRDDNSVWADLTADGLDEKLLLRKDGTSVYMTQDIGTAQLRQKDYKFDQHIYVVGNEQDYHFKVLSIILQKLGFDWAKDLFHLSYGMVELPEGKMKSREGTVVDADDLMDEMINTARDMSNELGKLDNFSEAEKEDIFRRVGLGALKYFMLKVDPKKNMTFNPKESVDFNGNTGPFIQYTYARIRSIFRKAESDGISFSEEADTGLAISDKEKSLMKMLYYYPEIIREAGAAYAPSTIANYAFDLAKEYNQFYHDHSMLKEDDKKIRDFRFLISQMTSTVLKSATELLGIEMPDRM